MIYGARGDIEKRLSRVLSVGEYRFHPEFSGRTAIAAIARMARDEGCPPLALVPDYICNAVYMALEYESFELEFYQTDSRCEPNISALEHKLSNSRGGLLITASVFGSSALIPWLSDEQTRKFLLSSKWWVLGDLCQDMHVRQQLPPGYGTRLRVSISFNDKRIPGVMGGGILSFTEPPSAPNLSLRQNLLLFLVFSVKLIRRYAPFLVRMRRWLRWAHRPQDARFDYSKCANFPFQLVRYRPSWFQLFVAWQGMRRLGEFEGRKLAWLLENQDKIEKTSNYATAPYLIVRENCCISSLRRRKHPYACHNDPDASLRPTQVVIHNKGFDDISTIA